MQIRDARTLAEFAQMFPSAVPVEQLAVLNQVPDASARFTAGTLLKRGVS